VATTLDLADGLVHAHRHGVVHGALDPETVAFPGTALTAHERQRPFVAYPGITTAYAGHVDVANYVDPRYAAPEYFDDRFGAVDHATDVYGLGLLCYRLVTGEHPYDGPLSAVREAVVDDRSLRPSAVDPALPPALDRVVEKATATRKLKRYETLTVFRRELRSIDGE
jgi:serine/threonine protein kinase